MHLRGIELRNYRRYREAVVAFPDGVIGFVGRNGAGKSTIVEAITWCLFGHDAARTNRDLIKRTGAAPGEECSVVIEFDVDGQGYRVTRRMRGASLQIEVVIESGGNLLVAGGPNSSAEGTEFLRKLLGFDREAFHASVVARQGELNALSDRTPGARKKLVGRMLGLDAVEAAVGRARAERREAEQELGFLREALEAGKAKRQRLDEARQRSKKLGEEAADFAKRRSELDGRLVTLEARHEEQQEARSRLVQAVERKESAAKELERVRSRRAKVRNDLAAIGDVHKSLAEFTKRKQELAPLAGRVEPLQEAKERFHQVDEAKRRLRSLQAEIATLSEQAKNEERLGAKEAELSVERDDLDGLRREADARLRELSSLAAALTERIENRTERLAEYRRRARELADLGPEAHCPLCEQPLAAARTVLEKKHAEEATRAEDELAKTRSEKESTEASLANARKEVDALDKRLKRCSEDAEAIRRRRDQARQAAAQAEKLRRQAHEMEEQIRGIEPVEWDPDEYAKATEASRQLSGVEQELARLEERRTRADGLAVELEALADEESRAVATLKDAVAKAKELEPALAAADETKAKLEEARSLREALARREAANETERKGLEKEIGTLEEEVAALDPKRARARELGERVRLMEFLASAHGEKGFLQEFKKHLISRIRPALARTASDLLATMTDRRYTTIELDEDYNVLVYDDGEALPIERFSGGETDVVNLALRLAINELVAQVRGRDRLSFIALDEVFGSQDRERRFHVLSALRGLRSAFRQVLVITHHEEVQERLEHVVHVIADGAAGSRLEVVGQSGQGFEPGSG